MRIDRVWAPAEAKSRKWTTRVVVADQERYRDGPVEFGSDWTPGTLDAVIGALAAIRESIPEEYRSTAMCEIDSESGYEGSHSPRVVVAYERPSTKEEIDARKADDAAKAKAQEEKDRQRYEALKAKFG